MLRSTCQAAGYSLRAAVNTFRSLSTKTDQSRDHDVIIAGAGHNGLVAAYLLAKQGLKVAIYEEQDSVGGACKTEHPFTKAPHLGQSTGAYLLGLMPPELLQILNLNLPLLRRDPHYFLPTTSDKYLLLGSDQDAAKHQFIKFFSEQDYKAHKALQHELQQLRTDLAPAILQQPVGDIEATAERFIRPELQQTFINMCRGSVQQYLDRFNFKSNLLKAMYASTDGLSGSQVRYTDQGGGNNFLLHNMCRLPGSDGTWMLVKGGMGVVTQQLAHNCRQAGVVIHTKCRVDSVVVEGGAVQGVVVNDTMHKASTVLVNADPFRLQSLVGPENLPDELNAKLDTGGVWNTAGMTLKVNLALKEFPTYTCLPQDIGQHRTTTHLLPSDEDEALTMLTTSYDQAVTGRLPEFPALQVYTQTAVDDSLRGSGGHHSAALFVQNVPYSIKGSSWEAEESAYVDHLLTVWERYAPGIKHLVADYFALTPPKIESHFGIARGVIFHLDNSIAFADRFPYSVDGVDGLYSCSAGCHPGGSVIGAAGHNSAARIIQDLGLKQWW